MSFKEADKVTPIPLTGGTVYFTINSSEDPASDGSAAIQKSVAGSSATSPLTGQHTFTLTPTDTTIDPGEYWYDSELIDAVGNKVSSYRGKFIVQSDITRT